MKKCLMFSILWLIASNTFAQRNLPVTFQEYAKRHSEKPTLVYFDLQWCGGAMSSKDSIIVLFDKLDDCYNVVLLTSSFEDSHYRSLKIDTVMNVNDFFKKGLVKSEIKKLSKEFQRLYNRDDLPFQLFGPGSFHFLKDATYFGSINNLYSETEKREYYCK